MMTSLLSSYALYRSEDNENLVTQNGWAVYLVIAMKLIETAINYYLLFCAITFSLKQYEQDLYKNRDPLGIYLTHRIKNTEIYARYNSSIYSNKTQMEIRRSGSMNEGKLMDQEIAEMEISCRREKWRPSTRWKKRIEIQCDDKLKNIWSR